VLFFFFELSNEVLLLSLLLFHFHSFFEMNATAQKVSSQRVAPCTCDRETSTGAQRSYR